MNKFITIRECGETGRRKGLKIPYQQWCMGSSPFTPTKNKKRKFSTFSKKSIKSFS